MDALVTQVLEAVLEDVSIRLLERGVVEQVADVLVPLPLLKRRRRRPQKGC